MVRPMNTDEKHPRSPQDPAEAATESADIAAGDPEPSQDSGDEPTLALASIASSTAAASPEPKKSESSARPASPEATPRAQEPEAASRGRESDATSRGKEAAARSKEKESEPASRSRAESKTEHGSERHPPAQQRRAPTSTATGSTDQERRGPAAAAGLTSSRGRPASTAGYSSPTGYRDDAYPAATRVQTDDAANDVDDEWGTGYSDRALFAAVFSAPALALAAFAFAVAGLLGGLIPESLPYLVQTDPASGPAQHVRLVGMISLGFAIIAASLGFAALLRSIGSPLRWPRYLGGAAVLLALLIALQSVLLLVLAAIAPPQDI